MKTRGQAPSKADKNCLTIWNFDLIVTIYEAKRDNQPSGSDSSDSSVDSEVLKRR